MLIYLHDTKENVILRTKFCQSRIDQFYLKSNFLNNQNLDLNNSIWLESTKDKNKKQIFMLLQWLFSRKSKAQKEKEEKAREEELAAQKEKEVESVSTVELCYNKINGTNQKSSL